MRIKIAGRLVGEEQPRSVGDAAGDGHALLLASGQLRRTVFGPLAEAKGLQQLPGALLSFSPREPENELRHYHVLKRRELREKVMELIDEADLVAAHARALGVAELDAIDAVDHHGAAVRPFEETGDMEQGGLAGARGPEQRHRLARIKRRGRALQHLDEAGALRVSALQPVEMQSRSLI